MLSRRFILFIVLAGAIAVLSGAASATPPTGQTTDVLARGSTGRLHVKHDGVRLKTRRRVDVAVATATFAPGKSSGWHHHPGLVVVVVKSGTIAFYNKRCHAKIHNAGDVFVESSNKPGLATNPGTVNAVVEATFIVPSSGDPAAPTPLRIDDPQPKHCGRS
jgi:quercetin dioxygenase-like cupin family protein